MFDAAGAKQPAREIKKVLELFTGSRDQSVDSFVADLELGLRVSPNKGNSSVSGSRKKTVKTRSTGEIADKLTSYLDSNEEFDLLLGDLKKKGKYKSSEIYEVTEKFLGYSSKYKNVGAAIEAIRSRQLQHAIETAQAGNIKPILGR